MDRREFALEQAVKLFMPSRTNDITFVLDAAEKFVLFLSNDEEKAGNSQESANIHHEKGIRKRKKATGE